MSNLTSLKMANTFTSLMHELEAESHRGAIVLAASWLDDQLTQLLKGFLCPPADNARDELLRVSGALGSFSVKIELAYRLGLLRKDVYRSLHIVRRLRNDFAHLTAKLDLDSPSVRDRVTTLFQLNEPVLEAIWHDVSELDELKQIASSNLPQGSLANLVAMLGVRPLLHMTLSITVAGLALATDQIEQCAELR